MNLWKNKKSTELGDEGTKRAETLVPHALFAFSENVHLFDQVGIAFSQTTFPLEKKKKKKNIALLVSVCFIREGAPKFRLGP
jgi:hypothetical protein